MSRWVLLGLAVAMCLSIVPADASAQARPRSTVTRQMAQATTVPARVPAAREAAPAPAAPDQTLPISLQQLVVYAESTNPILLKAQSEIEAAKGERVQAGLYPNPRMETNNPEIWSGQESYVNFGFQQDIVVKGKLRMEKAAADQLVRRESASYHVERMQMLTEIRKQYYVTLAAEHRLHLARYIVRISNQGLDAAQQLAKAGEGTETDVLLLDTQVQRSMSAMENAESTLVGEYKLLAAKVGMPDLAIHDIDGSLLSTPPEFDEAEIRDFLGQGSPYMAMGRAEIVRNSTLLRRAEVEPYPNIRMGPSYQTGTQPNSSQFWLSVVFDIPVWNLNQGNIRKAKADLANSMAELDVVRNQLLGKASDTLAQHRAARRVVDRIRHSILPNAQKTQALVQDGFSKGQFEVNRLLQSQHNLSDVATEYINQSEQVWTTAAELGGMLQLEHFP